MTYATIDITLVTPTIEGTLFCITIRPVRGNSGILHDRKANLSAPARVPGRRSGHV
jgi:hypothetical protein